MISRDAAPCAHVSPYKPIEVGGRAPPREPETKDALASYIEACAVAVLKRSEDLHNERIWAEVIRASGGEAPPETPPEIDYDPIF